MLAYFFLKGLGACMALVINATQARTVEYTMVLQAKWLALDGFYRETYTVNGQTPGPPLVVNEGDIVRVHVVNKLNELMRCVDTWLGRYFEKMVPEFVNWRLPTQHALARCGPKEGALDGWRTGYLTMGVSA